jgi:hypothetical protein
MVRSGNRGGDGSAGIGRHPDFCAATNIWLIPHDRGMKMRPFGALTDLQKRHAEIDSHAERAINPARGPNGEFGCS